MNKISIVIPVYNEGTRIAACLKAIAAQSVAPYEVIVVDNNSCDDTIEVASRYPFVKVITAKRQGVVHARNRGFNAVRGDIIGRIDADTRLSRHWVETVQQIFADEDVAAVSGAVGYHDFPLAKYLSKADLWLRRRAARNMGNEVFLQGANMAIRRSAWRAVRRHLCSRGGMHEDFDLAIHLADLGYGVQFREELQASISARALDDSIVGFWEYAWLNPSTYAQHAKTAGRHMYPIVFIVLALHVPLRWIYRSANPDESLAYNRVNPATFVD